MKSQLKRADKDGARFVVILGEDELAAGQVTIKDMAADGDAQDKQVRVPEQGALDWLVERLSAGEGREEA